MSCSDNFFDAYLEASLWSSFDDNDEPLDMLHLDVSEETQAEMRVDCDKFYDDNEHLITDENCLTPYDCDEQAGHDFWLTRNGHGTGFWDSGRWEPEACDQLDKASKAFGEYYLFAQDGEILGAKC